MSRAEQSRAEQSRAEQSRAGQGRAGQSRAEQIVYLLFFECNYILKDSFFSVFNFLSILKKLFFVVLIYSVMILV
ncbi:hypothetical protein [Methanobrevibacter sp.]|uniref:hypothetical protein n=1 Tax=Methanobrevibacter sp. TaxID=66852 RepID=UPI003D7E775F